MHDDEHMKRTKAEMRGETLNMSLNVAKHDLMLFHSQGKTRLFVQSTCKQNVINNSDIVHKII